MPGVGKCDLFFKQVELQSYTIYSNCREYVIEKKIYAPFQTSVTLFLPFQDVSRGTVAQLVERPSKDPESRCNSIN